MGIARRRCRRRRGLSLPLPDRQAISAVYILELVIATPTISRGKQSPKPCASFSRTTVTCRFVDFGIGQGLESGLTCGERTFRISGLEPHNYPDRNSRHRGVVFSLYHALDLKSGDWPVVGNYLPDNFNVFAFWKFHI